MIVNKVMNHIFVDTPLDLERTVVVLESSLFIALDIEYHDYYSYRGQVCLIQISTIADNYLIDPLAVDISPLRGVFESKFTLKVIHDASLERSALRRLHGINLCNVFDTIIAARVLRYFKLSLADLAMDLVGEALDKSLQRADWRQRPLSQEMLRYAVKDTECLLKIYLAMPIGSPDEFRLIMDRSNPAIFKDESPKDAWRRVAKKSKLGLNDTQKGLVQSICAWRDEAAQERDVSVHAIMSDQSLLNIVTARHTVREFRRIPMSRFVTYKREQRLLDLLNQASNSDIS